MRRKIIAIALCALTVIAFYWAWAVLNSQSFLRQKAERELAPILRAGTKKEAVVAHLIATKHPANDQTGRYANGNCATAHSGEFQWNCQYKSYVHSGWSTGFLHPFQPHLQVFFVFNEQGELVRHFISIGYSFI